MPRIIPIAILFRAILCEKFSRSSSRYALRSRPRTMQRSRIPRPHVVTRVRALTYTKMALKRLYINGGGRGGEKGRGEKTKNPVQIFGHRLFEESEEWRIGSNNSGNDRERKREKRKIRSNICYGRIITSQVSIRQTKEERLFLSPLSRNNHTFHSREIVALSPRGKFVNLYALKREWD